MDLMSDLGAYASLLYTAALTGAMKVLYTIVVAFALVASLHGVHTRAMIILDMQEVGTATVLQCPCCTESPTKIVAGEKLARPGVQCRGA